MSKHKQQKLLIGHLELTALDNKRLSKRVADLNNEVKDLTWRLHALCDYLKVAMVKVNPSPQPNAPMLGFFGQPPGYKVIPKITLLEVDDK